MPYLIPDDGLQQALETAALRGVEVTLIVPMQIDQYLVGLGQRSYYDEMMEAGVRVCRYGRRFLHAKCVTSDDSIVWIGSSNLDIRSFALNAEVVVLFYDPKVCARVAKEQARYIRDGEMLTLEEWRKRSPAIKVAENLARLLTPVL